MGYAMGYKCLYNVYCHTHCVFYDYCKSNIKKCIIFRFEQILSDLALQEFELEIFKMHFGLVDGLYYSKSELREKYHVSLHKVNSITAKVIRRLRTEKRRKDLT